MDSEFLPQILGVCAFFAIVFGPLLTRSSIRRDPIHSGTIAHIFHFVSATSFVAILPAIITGWIVGGHLGTGVPVAVTLLLMSLLSIFIFAFFEKPAFDAYEQQKSKEGWTEEDARTSGL